MVGLPGFEPGSREPKSPSLDQASRQPLLRSLRPLQPFNDFALIVKTLAKLQHLSKANQKAIWNRLACLSKHVDLKNAVEVEKFVYSMQCKNTYKNKLFEAYERFCNANDICYKKPKKLKAEEFVINVPTEQRIDTVIACCGWVYATVFNLSKHGLRPDEIAKLTLRNVDLEQGKINVPTSKLGAQRTIKLGKQTTEILREYVHRKKVQAIDQKLFGASCKIKENWRKYRHRAFEKLRDSELLKIRLYDLRHWFATSTYVKTRDIFYVKYLLGHRRLENTLIYVHLAKSLTDFPEDYTCATARSVEEASKLIEQGFDFVCDLDGVKLFRKRK
jgi:integrase